MRLQRNTTFWRFLVLLLALIVAAMLTSCAGAASANSALGGSSASSNLASTSSPQSSSSTPAPAPTSQAVAPYLYVGVFQDQGGVLGYHVDSSTGALAAVPGSPLLFATATAQQFSQAGPVAAVNGDVYVGYGPPGLQSPVIRTYALDSATGGLGTYTETDAGSVGNEEQMTALVTDSIGHNLYVVYTHNIASFQINADGSLVHLGTLANLALAAVFSLAISPTGNIAFVGVDNCPPKGTCAGPPDILLLDRDPNTGDLSNTGQLMGQNNVWSPGTLAFAPSGKYLLAWTTHVNGNSQISVYGVDYSRGTLTLAPGSPYAIPGGLSPVAFGFDSSGGFLYVLNSAEFLPQAETLAVYTFAQSTGTLTQIENESLPSGNFPAALRVDDAFVFVVDSRAGPISSVIYVLPRDANAGTVASPVFTQTVSNLGLGEAVELRF